MSIESQDVLNELIARLPELEWKISGLGPAFSNHQLPKGLFRARIESGNSAACITEIKTDIEALSQQQNKRSAFYLAERIRQKINVLVGLCQLHRQKDKIEEKIYFGIKALSTRQQWINDLETELHTLEKQQYAVAKTLEQMLHSQNTTAILHLKVELGEIERRLTLAKETLNRAIS